MVEATPILNYSSDQQQEIVPQKKKRKKKKEKLQVYKSLFRLTCKNAAVKLDASLISFSILSAAKMQHLNLKIML